MNYNKFRRNLKNIIDSRRMTAKDFAYEVELSQPTICRYLKGERNPELEPLIKIASYCGVSVDWLIGISGDKFDVMPKNVQEVANAYSLASTDDRRVVDAVLEKYIKNW